MKILITGADGQLGQEFVKVFKAKNQVIPTDKHNLDFTNEKQTFESISKSKPDLIVHCGAWTDVDGCAREPEKAVFINGEGTKYVAKAALQIGAKMVYISTNEVFDGEKKQPYLEDDEPNPITPYGKSKREGEIHAEKILGSNCSIIRVSWLYGPASKVNFPNKILSRAQTDGYLKVVDDEISTPTYAPDLAQGMEKLLNKKTGGIFHLVNEGFGSRYDWAKLLLELTEMNQVKIEAIKLKDFERASKPPNYGVLKNARAAKLGVLLRDWRDACAEYVGTARFINFSNKSAD